MDESKVDISLFPLETQNKEKKEKMLELRWIYKVRRVRKL